MDATRLVEHAGQLADRHALSRRLGSVVGEVLTARIGDRTLHRRSTNRVRTVEDDQWLPCFRAGLEKVSESGLVGIETNARVLDVVHHGIKSLQHLRRRPSLGVAPAVHAVNRHAGCCIVGVIYIRRVEFAKHAMLGTEQSCQFYARRMREHVDGALPLRIDASLVSDQANAPLFAILASQRVEVVGFEDIDACQCLPIPRSHVAEPRIGLVVAGDSVQPRFGVVAHPQVKRSRDCGSKAGAKGDHITALQVNRIGEQDDVGIRGRIDPQGGAGKPGMPKAADGKQFSTVGGKRCIDIPTQAANIRLVSRLLGRCHLLDRQRRPYLAIVVEQRLSKLRHIVGSREHSRVSGNAAHLSRGRVMDGAAQHASGMLIDLRGSNPVTPFCRRQVSTVLHAKRTEDVLRGVTIERFAAEPLHQFTEHDEVDVAIPELRPRRRHQLLGVGPPVPFF